MKKGILMLGSVVCMIMITWGITLGSAFAATPIKLKMQTYDTPGTYAWGQTEKFCRDVKAMSNSRVEIIMHPSGGLVPNTEMLNAVGSGMLDMEHGTPAYWTGLMPEAAVYTMPMLMDSNQDAFEIYHYLHGYADLLRAAYKDRNVHLLSVVGLSPMRLWSKGPINNLKDLKGKKIRWYGAWNTLINKLGGSAVSMPSADTYMALSLGTIDGTGNTLTVYNEWKHYEMCKHLIRTPSFGSTVAEIGINMNTWKKMPDDLKAILEVASNEYSYRNGQAYQHYDDEFFYSKSKKLGTTLIDWPESDIKEMRRVAVTIWDELAKNQRSKEMVQMAKEYLKFKGQLP